MDDDLWDDGSIFYGFGSMHDLRDAQGSDPRNPRLIGLKSVSYDAAVALNNDRPKPIKRRKMGFRIR